MLLINPMKKINSIKILLFLSLGISIAFGLINIFYIVQTVPAINYFHIKSKLNGYVFDVDGGNP